MGLNNTERTGGAWTFVNFKDGDLVAKVDGVRKTFTDISGIIKMLDVTDEVYQDKPYKKITLYIIDGESEYRLGFPLNSGYGNAFCSLAPNIDFKKEVIIDGGIEPMDNGKKRSKLFIKQKNDAGKFVNLKWYYTKDNEAGKKLPQGEKKSDRNGEYTDFTKRNEWFLKMLIDPKKSIFQAIKKVHPKFEAAKSSGTSQDIPDAKDITDPLDELPF